MDHISTPPQGSAILAYGRAPKSQSVLRWLAVIGAAIFVFLFAVFGYVLAFTSTELPANRLITGLVIPNQIHDQLPPGLVTDLPAPWRSVIETESALPAILGAWIDERGTPHAFASVLRVPYIAPSEQFKIQKRRWSLLITTTDEFVPEHIPVRTLLRLRNLLKKNDVAWMIDSSALQQIVGEEPGDDRVFGTWSGSSGTILLDPTDDVTEADITSPLIVTLGASRVEADPLMRSLVTQGVDLSGTVQTPSGVYINPASGSTTITWSSDLPEAEQMRILGFFGKATSTPYALPDESVVFELTPSVQLIGGIENTEQLAISASGISAIRPVSGLREGDCPGLTRFSIEGDVLESLLKAWNWPESWREQLNRFMIRQSEDAVRVCAE